MFQTSQASRNILALTFGVLLTAPLMAAPQPQAMSGWSWSAHIGNLNIDSAVAKSQGIDESAFVIGGAAERYSTDSILTFVIGADLIGYDDNYAFTQDTNKGEKSSDASAAMIYAEFGPRMSLGKGDDNYFIAHLGVSGIFSSERGVSYCINCYSETIDVNGGFYGVLGVGHSFSGFDLGLQFQQYFSGDVDNSLRLQISTSF